MYWSTKIHKNILQLLVAEDGSVVLRANVYQTTEAFEQHKIVSSLERAFCLRCKIGHPLTLRVPNNFFVVAAAVRVL